MTKTIDVQDRRNKNPENALYTKINNESQNKNMIKGTINANISKKIK